MDKRRLVGYTVTEIAGMGCLALLLYYLALSGATSIPDPWSVDRVVAYVLLFLAPLFLFLPFSMALRLGPVWALGAGSWALLGYVLVFVPSPDRSSAGLVTYVAFLALLFVALTTALSIPLGALSARFLPPANASWVRPLRQGSLAALFVVSLLAMSPLGVLNWLNVMLVFTIVALAEFFFLARN